MKIKNLDKLNRDRAYVNHVPLRDGEVTIVTSVSAEASMVHSCRLGADMQKAGVPTLILNCAISDKRFREYFAKNHKWSNKLAKSTTAISWVTSQEFSVEPIPKSSSKISKAP